MFLEFKSGYMVDLGLVEGWFRVILGSLGLGYAGILF